MVNVEYLKFRKPFEKLSQKTLVDKLKKKKKNSFTQVGPGSNAQKSHDNQWSKSEISKKHYFYSLLPKVVSVTYLKLENTICQMESLYESLNV